MTQPEKSPYHLKWSDAMSTGVEAIDNDHKKLLSLITQLSEVIDSNKDKDALKAVFSELENTSYSIFRVKRR